MVLNTSVTFGVNLVAEDPFLNVVELTKHPKR